MFLVGILLGIILGMIIISIISISKLNKYEEDLHIQILLRKNRDKFINYLSNRNTELREKNRDLENNIEILVNNLPNEIKEVINDRKINQ